MKPWKHFKTITYHKWLVLQGCFKVGLYWQGLTHDLSKYSPTEFWSGARFYQGDRSPNTAEREAKGVSEAWIHHKGRNKHHYEYWTDMDMKSGVYVSVPVPRKYVVEMVMDRRAACMTYHKKTYSDSAPAEYFEKSREKSLMHPQLQQELGFLLGMLARDGEKATFRYIKKRVLKGKPFPWEENLEKE